MEMSFPADAPQSDADIGGTFLATDYTNLWLATVHADGKAELWKQTNGKYFTVWKAATNNLVKTGPTDVNSVRAAVKNGTITVIDYPHSEVTAFISVNTSGAITGEQIGKGFGGGHHGFVRAPDGTLIDVAQDHS